MLYGIDFGTTYTVISYRKDDKLCFVAKNNGILIPTSISGVQNLKRVILEKTRVSQDLNGDLLKVLIEFFFQIKELIMKDVLDQDGFFNCIITVPVRFNDLARYFIKYCAIMAGFNVLKLLQEPIAAAIASINQKDMKDGSYIVYDLGGGTFDATLIKKTNNFWHVLKVDGLEDFGGYDLDCYISKLMNVSTKKAEQIKKDRDLDLDELLIPTYKIVERLSNDVDCLILAGGSSYLKNIEKFFKHRFQIIKAENLQLLVSEGALLFGENFIEESQFLIDVTPFHLGVEVLGGKMEVLIEANSPIPIRCVEKFMPVNNMVCLNILQGDSLIASECNKLGKITLRTQDPFNVEFILDCDGILSVKALDQLFVLSNLFSA